MTDDKETAARLTSIAKQLRERDAAGFAEYLSGIAKGGAQVAKLQRAIGNRDAEIVAPHIEANKQALEALERIIQGVQITPVGGGDGDTCTIQGAPSPAAVIEAREAITTLRNAIALVEQGND